MAEDLDQNESESSEDLLPFYSISSWGADYTVEVLVNRLKKDDIFIPPFQRQYVWTLTRASRFIESLVFGLPVPGIFLSKEKETNRLLVIDGQQRLMSLFHFLRGRLTSKMWQIFNLLFDFMLKCELKSVP